jgi:alpha-galactosidase
MPAMAAIPGFFLKRLYVARSLASTPRGLELRLRNQIGAGTLVGIDRIEIDGIPHPTARLRVEPPVGPAREAPGITPDAPLAITEGEVLRFVVGGVRLAPGRHAVSLRLVTREVGAVDIPVSDEVRDETVSVASVGKAPARAEAPAVQPGAATRARPLRIALLGAGSAVFARQLMADMLTTPGLETGTFVLVDIDRRRLELAHRIGEMMARASGRRWKVQATADRRRALRDCDYVINTIEVAGLRNVRHDYDIPMKYGVDQCIGDTIGPGGIFKMLRTGPAWLAILRDAAELCPGAVMMNYTNPMSALTLLALRASRMPVIGLCHSVQNTAAQLAGYLDVPAGELRWRCAGINHLAWFTELRHRGKDMYPRLDELARDPEMYEADPVRFEVMRHFGAFVTESSGHLSEYVPYFRKRPELLARYTRGGYTGESGYYANNWPAWRRGGDDSIRELLDGRSTLVLERSDEYASVIIEGIECGPPTVVHGNVLNAGLIENLPAGGCVEVAVAADAGGLHPARFGPLPPQMAALDAAHMYVHELMVEAVLERDLGAARRALLLDPLSAAVCSPEEIFSLFDEMVDAERTDLREYRPPSARRAPPRSRAPESGRSRSPAAAPRRKDRP